MASLRTGTKKRVDPVLMVGWREVVHFPGLGLNHVPVKIDTGARTTAIHAHDIVVSGSHDKRFVEFTLPVLRLETPRRVSLPVADVRDVKNTGGVPQSRVVVVTDLTVGGRTWPIELTLADRADMEYPVIIGRQAMRGQRIAVYPGRSFLTHEALQSSSLDLGKS